MRHNKRQKAYILLSMSLSSQLSYTGLFQKHFQNQAETEAFLPSWPRSAPTGMVAAHQQVLLSCQINYSKGRKGTRVSVLDSLLLGEVG